jgi:uracil-DNA glycosylase
MGDDLKSELAAWLEFYRDIGLGEFYRRDPGADIEMRKSKIENHGQPDTKVISPGARSMADTRTPNPEPRALIPESRIPNPQPRTLSITPPPAPLSLFEVPPPLPKAQETLAEIEQDLGDCQRCKLAPTRNKIVFGQGDPHAALVFIGEGPGADEDEQGLPFVGRAGKLLNRMIQSIDMKREEVYICNIVKCRPPMNRTPEKDEVDACSPFLFRQIQAIKPRLICCLGSPAMKTLLGIKEGITKVRGQIFDFAATKVLVAYHPAYILRNPREEKILREDFEKIREFLKAAQ